MGYYVETTDIDFAIAAEKLDAAYAAMCELNAHDELKNGGYRPADPSNPPAKPKGSTSVSNSPHKFFSWMEWNYDEIYDTAEEIFSALGFDCYVEDNGDLRLLVYDNKSGAEECFLNAVAPYVTPGSFIDWQGEYGELYRWEFDGTTMNQKNGEIVWR